MHAEIRKRHEPFGEVKRVHLNQIKKFYEAVSEKETNHRQEECPLEERESQEKITDNPPSLGRVKAKGLEKENRQLRREAKVVGRTNPSRYNLRPRDRP